jgi:hypothetical protein
MSFNLKHFGLKRDYLYEIIATSYSINDDGLEIVPNASCMGIRVIDGDKIQISPFYSTTTYKNLKKNSIIVINFVDDVFLYALAALKEKKSPIGLNEVPLEYYNFKYLEDRSMDVPFIKKAWGILIGEVSEEFVRSKEDDLGEMIIPIFKLEIIFAEIFKKSHNLFNRAENLALEAIILATRIKVAKENKNLAFFSELYEKILNYTKKIKRFGKNEGALKAIDLVNKYIHHIS